MGTVRRIIAISALVAVAGCGSSGSAHSSAVTVPRSTTTSEQASTTTTSMPGKVPGPPVPVSAVPYGSGVAKLIWEAPTTNGGSAIIGYVVTPFVGASAQPKQAFGTPATTQMIAGLQNGKVYQFEIAAKNAVGLGPYSPNSGSMTVGAPGQPGNATAVKVGTGSLKATFAAPGDSGATITSYAVACKSSNGGAGKTKTGGASPITVAGLTAGKSYTCTIKAANSRGTGPASSPSKAVTV